MKDLSTYQPSLAKQHSKAQRWIAGCGLVLALGTVAAVLAVRYNPDLLRPLIKSGVPLEAASNWPIIGYAIQQAETPLMSVQELKQLVDSKTKDYLLIDVRTPDEYKVSHIPGATLVPLIEIENGTGIDKIKSSLQGRRLLAYCTSGKRSARALVVLQQAGIKGTKIEGGIKSWTEEIDPSLPRNNW